MSAAIDLRAALATTLGHNQPPPARNWDDGSEDAVLDHLTACDGCRRCGQGGWR